MIKAITNKQPSGFHIFFLTEMWERYGFYVIQTLLIFYLSQKLHLSDKSAYTIVGSFTALAYINCIFGGLIADKLIGSSTSILFGGIILSLGYSSLSFSQSTSLFSISLAIISVGTGLLKPNVTGLLSSLYNHNNQQKEQGYTLYYTGIYVGALSGSIIGGVLESHTTWAIAFLTAALGSIIASITFWLGLRKYHLKDKRLAKLTITALVKALIGILCLSCISYLVLNSDTLGLAYFIAMGLFCLIYVIFVIITHHGNQRNKLIAFLLLTLLSVVYWGIYFQQFFSLSLCIERICGDISVPTSTFSAIESLGIILFSPLVNKVWKYFETKNQPISTPTKFSIGFLINSSVFLLITLGLLFSSLRGQYLSPFVIMFAYLLLSIGELSIAPTGLAIASTLVPAKYVGAMTGISLLTIGFGGKLAGLLANDTIISPHSSIKQIEINYMGTFFKYFIISLIAFIVILSLKKYLIKLIFKGN